MAAAAEDTVLTPRHGDVAKDEDELYSYYCCLLPSCCSGASLSWSLGVNRVKRSAKVTAAVVRAHPSTFVVPLCLLAVMLVLGLWGVTWGANQQAQRSKQQAQSFAVTYLADYNRDIQQQVKLPLSFLKVAIRQNPLSWAALNSSLTAMIPDIIAETGLKAQVLDSIQIAPQGITQAQYLNKVAIPGASILSPTSASRPAAFTALRVRGPVLTGPYTVTPALVQAFIDRGLYSGTAAVILALKEAIGIRYTVPVYVAARSPPLQTVPVDVTPAADCAAECTQVVDGEVFWGFVSVTRSIESFVKPRVMKTVGLRWEIRAPLRNVTTNLDNTTLTDQTTVVIARGDADVRDPVSTSVVMDATNATWTLYVSPESGTWRPSWEVPMIVVVVLVSVALSTMQFMALLAWRQHGMLLASLLPQSVLQQLRKDHDFQDGGGKGPAVQVDGTPADTMLRVLECALQSEPPDLRDVVMVRTTLMRGADVYRPLDLTAKLKATTGLDSEVARALARELDGSYTTASGSLTADDRDTLASSSVHGTDDDEHYTSVRSALATFIFMPTSIGSRSRNAPTDEPVDSSDGTAGDRARTRSLQFDRALRSSIRSEVRICLEHTHGSSSLDVTNGTEVCSGTSSPREASFILEAPAPLAQTVIIKDAKHGEVKASVDEETLAVVGRMDTYQPHHTFAKGLKRSMNNIPRQLQLDQAERQLILVDQWDFDVMVLATATRGRPLSALGFYVLSTTGLMDTFKLKRAVVARFLTRIEESYVDNPYHNATHAADVVQTMHMLLQHGGLSGTYADPLGQLACYTAAIVHDLGHLGRTNDFLCATSHELAVRYNDRAPHENHHVSLAFQLMREPGLDFLAPLAREQRNTLRRMVIDLVLATDMKQHFSVISQFRTLHGASISAARSSKQQAKVSELGHTTVTPPPRLPERGSTKHAPSGSAGKAAQIDDAGKLLTLQFALKCSDLGHLSAPLPVHLRWVAALEEEYFLQGDAEKAAGLPVSPLFDRNKPGITKSQVGFFNIVVLPLFQALEAALPAALPLGDAVGANFGYWQGREAKDKEKASALAAVTAAATEE